MRAAALIAVNLVRQQRWIVLLMVAYVAVLMGVAAAVSIHGNPRDLVFMMRQLGSYAVLLAFFSGAMAVHNERRSRRILAVLSKGIERSQYLAGLLLGIALMVGIYCAVLGAASVVALAAGGLPLTALPAFLAVLLVACLLAAMLAMFFATFLHPWFALAVSGVVAAIPPVLEQVAGGNWDIVLPAYALTASLSRFTLLRPWEPGWALVGVALAESAALWLAASWIFARRDITVAVE
jgi:ABC-type transport system involved in multi-copper enzyme maturation permease subunit